MNTAPKKKLSTTQKKLLEARARGEPKPIWVTKKLPKDIPWHLPSSGVTQIFLDAHPIDHQACGFTPEDIQAYQEHWDKTRPLCLGNSFMHRPKTPPFIDWDALREGRTPHNSRPPSPRGLEHHQDQETYEKNFPVLKKK